MQTPNTPSTAGNGRSGERFISITVSLSATLASVNFLLNVFALSGVGYLNQSLIKVEQTYSREVSAVLGGARDGECKPTHSKSTPQ